MKKTYALLMSGAMLMSVSLMSCSGENTTGVDTGNTANEAGGGMNDAGRGGGTEDFDGADAAGTTAGQNMNGGNGANSGGNTLQGNSDSGAGADTARTTTPSTDNGF